MPNHPRIFGKVIIPDLQKIKIIFKWSFIIWRKELCLQDRPLGHPWAIWCSGWQPRPRQGGWSSMTLRDPSYFSHSMILRHLRIRLLQNQPRTRLLLEASGEPHTSPHHLGAKRLCSNWAASCQTWIHSNPSAGPKEIFRLESVHWMYMGSECISQLLELQISNHVSRARHLPFSYVYFAV